MMNMHYLIDEKEIKHIFEDQLNIQSSTVSIESLLSFRNVKRINYSPDYQRNYVWEKDKATYFIESILIGTEIPPLVFYKKGNEIEIIDGRQRFETIFRFSKNEFSLTNKGLNILKELVKKSYDELDEDIVELFNRTQLRIIEFQIMKGNELDPLVEDIVKKEIFRRYNSGITPLKNVEVEKAKYITDDITKYFKQQFNKKPEHYELLINLIFQEREFEKKYLTNTFEKALQKIRHLLILNRIPINYYSTCSKEVLNKFYEMFSDEIVTDGDVSEVYKEFIKKLDILQEFNTMITYENQTVARLVNECIFWGLSVLDIEGKNFKKDQTSFHVELKQYIENNLDKYKVEDYFFSKQLRERYEATAKFFGDYFDIDFNIYLKNSNSKKEEIKNVIMQGTDTAEVMGQLESLRLTKPSVSDVSIEEIERKMNRKKFLIRPLYQREESINIVKSSAIIESILLGIKLPPVFVYQRNDGLEEVIDGQQRLLSILGFIGSEFRNANGDREKSQKHEFALTKLRILTDLNGKKYKDLDEEYIDRILDFKLYIVEIHQRTNPEFDPIDLFIRLNNKPYPIKEDSFEMWNSYVDMDIISMLKDNKTEDWYKWFYYRRENVRMENEEFLTYLTYLEFEYKYVKNSLAEILHMFEKGTKLEFRIRSKNEVTKLLNLASNNNEVKNQVLDSVKEAKKFIKKVKLLLIDKDLTDNQEKFLKDELDILFNIKETTGRRTMQSFYALWFFLKPINNERIKYDRDNIKSEIKDMFKFIKDTPVNNATGANKEFFEQWLAEFWKKYSIALRNVQLTSEKKLELIQKQNNICPICKSSLYFGQDIEVDHIMPIAVGGLDSEQNLQITHMDCNRKKGSRYQNSEATINL